MDKENKEINDDSKRPYTGMENLQFKLQHLKFYPEDEEKMASMSVRERIEYRRILKGQNKFIILDDTH